LGKRDNQLLREYTFGERRHFSILALLALFLVSCMSTPVQRSASSESIYVLSAQNDQGDHNLSMINPKTWKVFQTVSIPNSRSDSFSLDPQGRIWIGFSGNFDVIDNRVQVYTSEGKLVTTLTPCDSPSAGISFVANRAFIGCAEDGSHGTIAVIDLDTFAMIRTINLSVPEQPYLLTASAATENAILVSGLTSGPKETGYAVLTLVDPNKFAIEMQSEPLQDADIWQILPEQQQFYLLNVGGWRVPGVQDLLKLNENNSSGLERLGLAEAPLWGEIADNYLYAYHNPTYNQPNSNPHRQLSRLELRTGKVETWPLPDYWDAGDLALADGKILLTAWMGNGDDKDGLYQFDPETGELLQLTHIPNADKLIVVR